MCCGVSLKEHPLKHVSLALFYRHYKRLCANARESALYQRGFFFEMTRTIHLRTQELLIFSAFRCYLIGHLKCLAIMCFYQPLLNIIGGDGTLFYAFEKAWGKLF